MRITFLVDNQAEEGLGCEWGLSMLVERGGSRVLLDAGATGLFAENAERLGIDLETVDAAVLSHAHFDHAGGLDAFCAANAHAPVWMLPCGEDCYSDAKGFLEYIGLPEGMLSRLAGRIRHVGGKAEVAPGVWALPHATAGLAAKGEASRMYVGPDISGGMPEAVGEGFAYDDFSHELTLVCECEDGEGLVVINSCSHSGADVVVAEAMEAFPGRPVRALTGGFHLFMSPESEVRALASRLRGLGVTTVCTGHCTGDAALAVLREELGDDVVSPTSAGLVLEL